MKRSDAYGYAVMAAGALALSLAAAGEAIMPTAGSAYLLALSVAFGSVNLRLGNRVTLSVSQPFIFAGLLHGGPLTGSVIAIASIVATAIRRRPRLRGFQVFFNLATVVLSTVASWRVLSWIDPPPVSWQSEAAVYSILAASLAYFVVNTWLVAGVIGLESGRSIAGTWRQNLMWAGPSFMVSGAVGYALARVIDINSYVLLLLAAPVSYAIFYAYRLYRERLTEQQGRVESVQELNAQLECKVKERTAALAALYEQLLAANHELAVANRSRADFLANVSHELRTPLVAIIGFSELLSGQEYGQLSAENARLAREVEASGVSLLGQINRTLDCHTPPRQDLLGSDSVSEEELDVEPVLE